MSLGGFSFEIEARDTQTAARAGRLRTPHGDIQTPVFMPVGTQAAVKGLCQEDLLAVDAQIILANAYHLYLRPGVEVIQHAGGLHRFMGWDRAILTDSGGFQLFSLAKMSKVADEGVAFQSHIDGAPHFLTPETATDVQLALGADILMCFDECTHYPVGHAEAAASMRRTMAWAVRCKNRWLQRDDGNQALFGIVQGSVYEDLRRESAQCLSELDLPGYAVGGVSVGETKEELWNAVNWSLSHLPEDKPRYLMGVGPPEDLLEAVSFGIDLFDCVAPTRNARNGALFTRLGRLNIRNNRFRRDFAPIDPACRCPVCRRYSRAYLAHLYHAGEISALRLNTLHNLHFMLELGVNVRDAVRTGRFLAFKKSFMQRYKA